jgi:hypothetical protein
VKWAARAAGTWLVLLAAAHAHSAFETIRDISSPAAFDPIIPGLHYWHALPERLIDARSRLHFAAAQPYGLTALRTVAADVTLHPGGFGFGWSCTALGQSSYYSELLISSAVAVRLVNFLALGAGVQYGSVQFGQRFGGLYEFAGSAGLRVAAGKRFSVDVAARSPVGGSGHALAVPGFVCGFICNYSTQASLRISFDSPLGWSFGETVKLGSNLAFGADLLTSPLRLRVNALLHRGPFGFSFLYRDHPELGGDLVVGLLLRL